MTPADVKIALAGYYGFSNVGDELLLQVVLDGIRKRLPGARPVVLSNAPAYTASAHQVESVSRWNLVQIVRAFWHSDRLLFGGGGIFQDRTSKRSLLYYTGLVVLARTMGVPVVLCAVGVDSLRRFGSRIALRLALGCRAVAIGVRDSASAAALEEAGLFEGIGLFSDLVFSLDVPPAAPGNRIALVVRKAPRGKGDEIFARVARLLAAQGLEIDAMSFQPGPDATAAVPSGGPAAPFVDFREAPGRVAQARCVVSGRFHALVLAALAGRPFLGIGGDVKVQSLCRQLVMPFVPFDATAADVDRAVQELLTMAPPDVRRIGALRRRAEEALDDALGVL